MNLKIVLDENIPHAQEIFSPFGSIVALPGRKITNADLMDADALIIRSVTNVDKSLLQNTSVKFVGTCTIGTDHVKEKELEDLNVHFCSAPGCNAQSVAEYVLTSLLDFAKKTNTTLKGKSIGIIGVGNVGSLVANYARALEMQVLLNDPPRERNGDSLSFVPLKNILNCDFISLHVPLNKQGADKTFHLFDAKTISKMKPSAVLINTCRGSVVNNVDLKAALHSNVIQSAILDVWEKEPNIDTELFNLCHLGTPHIAGYSYDAKIRGGTMIADKLASFFHLASANYEGLGKSKIDSFQISQIEDSDELAIKSIANLFYDPQEDHNALKISISDVNHGENFDNLRKNYRKRREFQIVPLKYKDSLLKEKLVNKLKSLQFKILL
jgi:erythronate-4-phosphate dehydrogenase